jgi:hypothetical protein
LARKLSCQAITHCSAKFSELSVLLVNRMLSLKDIRTAQDQTNSTSAYLKGEQKLFANILWQMVPYHMGEFLPSATDLSNRWHPTRQQKVALSTGGSMYLLCHSSKQGSNMLIAFNSESVSGIYCVFARNSCKKELGI